MAYFIDATDDVLAFDGIRSFTGGQASGLQSDQLAQNQVQRLVNMTLSPKGNLETRRGVTSFNTTATSQEGSIGGMAYYDTTGTEDLVTVTQGRLYTINANGEADIHPADEVWGRLLALGILSLSSGQMATALIQPEKSPWLSLIIECT
jgi:hypothetical protein